MEYVRGPERLAQPPQDLCADGNVRAGVAESQCAWWPTRFPDDLTP